MSAPTPTGRRKSLGRGLSALIPDELVTESTGPVREGLRSVALDTVRPNPEQPRRHFAKEPLEELAASIREHGVMNPLVVRSGGAGTWILVAGERRLRAAGLAGLTEVPVLVREVSGSAEELELALVENLQREDLDPVEAARGYERLIVQYGRTQAEVARSVGCDRSSVANSVRMLRLPEPVLRLVSEGRLSTGHAKALLGVEDPDVLREIVTRILARQLSVRATENLVRSRSAVKRTVQVRKDRERVLDYASQLLTRSLQTQVAVKPKARGAGGRIVIEYYSKEELERLIQRLREDG